MEHNEACLKGYSEIIDANPLLTREEELAMFKILKKFKGGKQRQATRDRLVNSNIRLVVKEASTLGRHSHVAMEDLIGAGIEGLCIAIDRFNPRKKTKLSTYAVPWIRLKIYRIIEDFASSIHTPRHVREQSRKYRKIQNAQDKDAVLTDAEFMEELNITQRGLHNVRMAQAHVVLLSSSRYTDDSGSEMTMEDVIADKNAVTAEKIMEAKEEIQKIDDEVSKLKPIDAEVIRRRYLSDVKEDLRDIGKSLGLTGERVRQIEFKALKVLRGRMKNRAYFGV